MERNGHPSSRECLPWATRPYAFPFLRSTMTLSSNFITFVRSENMILLLFLLLLLSFPNPIELDSTDDGESQAHRDWSPLDLSIAKGDAKPRSKRTFVLGASILWAPTSCSGEMARERGCLMAEQTSENNWPLWRVGGIMEDAAQHWIQSRCKWVGRE